MSLKPCIWCSQRISDKAMACPQCGHASPFDVLKKQASELSLSQKQATERELKAVHETVYACPDCNLGRRLNEIWKTRTCPKCGNPDTAPKCTCCSKPAVEFDLKRHALVCNDHVVEICSHCHAEITKGDKVRRSYTSNYSTSKYVYHTDCTPERVREQRAASFMYKFWGIAALISIFLLAMCTRQ